MNNTVLKNLLGLTSSDLTPHERGMRTGSRIAMKATLRQVRDFVESKAEELLPEFDAEFGNPEDLDR